MSIFKSNENASVSLLNEVKVDQNILLGQDGPSYHGLDRNKGLSRDQCEKAMEEEEDKDQEEELARLAHIPLIRPPLGPAESHGPHTSSSSTSSSSTSSSPTCSSFFSLTSSSSTSSSSPLTSSPTPLPCCSRCKSGGRN